MGHRHTGALNGEAKTKICKNHPTFEVIKQNNWVMNHIDAHSHTGSF